jgi:TatD DNase family protein
MTIDSHCHLADVGYVADLGDVVRRAREAGLSAALVILSADESDEVARASAVSAAWPAVLFAAGVHPHRAGAYGGRAAEAARVTTDVVRATGAKAVGEIGLDYFYDHAPRDVQREVFDAQVGAAAALGRPVVIHAREAAADTLEVLDGHAGVRAVLHCFTGTIEEARAALDRGHYVSISGIATFPKAEALRDVARFVPEDRLLVETDAPFLAPVPHRGSRNEPAYVVETLRAVAAARGVDAGALGAVVRANFDRFLGLVA